MMKADTPVRTAGLTSFGSPEEEVSEIPNFSFSPYFSMVSSLGMTSEMKSIFLSLFNHSQQNCPISSPNLWNRPRDCCLYVDADTSFDHKDVLRMYNGLMKKAKCGLVCGEIRVRNINHNIWTL